MTALSRDAVEGMEGAMRRVEFRFVSVVLVAFTALFGARAEVARAQEADDDDEAEGECADEDEDDYNEAGVVEVGGALGFSWTDELFTLDLGPTIGWFVVDGFEISLIGRLEYENAEQDDGSREDGWTGSLVVEPSYHVPIHAEALYAFGGLGIGAGYDGDDPDFELIPRVGLNIEFGEGGVLTPALRVPILMGPGKGDGDDFGVQTGVAFEIGVTSTL